MVPSHPRSSLGQVRVAEWALQMENGRRGSCDGKRGFGLSPTREWLHPQMPLPSLTLKLRSRQQKLSPGTQKILHPQPREGGSFSEIQKEKAGFQERQTDKESLIDPKQSDRKGNKHPMAFNIQTEKEKFTPRKPRKRERPQKAHITLLSPSLFSFLLSFFLLSQSSWGSQVSGSGLGRNGLRHRNKAL